MLWSKLSEYWHQEEGSNMNDDGYIVYLPNDDLVFEVEDEYGDMYATDYMQIMRNADKSEEFVFQTLTEDPINIPITTYANDTNIPAKIYKKIDVD